MNRFGGDQVFQQIAIWLAEPKSLHYLTREYASVSLFIGGVVDIRVFQTTRPLSAQIDVVTDIVVQVWLLAD